MRHNQSGFSIIEVIMSFAILGLVAAGFLSFTDNHAKITKSIDASFEVVDFVGQVRLILSQPKGCMQTLAAAGIPVSSSSDKPITTIKGANIIPGSNPTAWINYDFISNGSTISASKTVTLTSMVVKYPPTFNGEVELVMKFTRNDQASVGGKEITRTLPLTIVANPAIPTQIQTCYATGAKVANWGAMCAALGGTYSEDTKKCSKLFTPSFTSQVTPGGDHCEKLIYNKSTGEVKIIITGTPPC